MKIRLTNQGLTNEHVQWLWENVGPGSFMANGYEHLATEPFAWQWGQDHISHPLGWPYRKIVSTLTFTDPAKATWFALRWLR